MLAVGGLVVNRAGDEPQQLTIAGAGASTTIVATTTSAAVPTVTEPPSTAAPSTTATTQASAPAAPRPTPSTPLPAGPPAAEQLRTEAGGHGRVAAALAQARARWAAAKPAAGYTWSYENECRCSPRRVEVVVGGAGTITAARALDGSSSQGVQGLTVEAARAELQRAVDSNAASIRVRFDPRNGLPWSYFIDQSRGVADEEHGITVIALIPRS